MSAGYGELFGSEYCDAFYIQAKLSTRNKGKAQWFSGKVDRRTMAKSIPIRYYFSLTSITPVLLAERITRQEFWRRGSMPASSLVDSETAKKYL